MSNDPFGEDPHPARHSHHHSNHKLTSPEKKHPRTPSGTNNAFPLFSSPGQSPSYSGGGGGGTTQHLTLPHSFHDRTVSEDIEDHMMGSQFRPTDICPACQMPRMATIQCPVTQLHHGSDLPWETPKKRQNRGFFSRLRESFQSHNHSDGPMGNASDSQPTSAVHKEVPFHHQHNGEGGADTDTSSSPTTSSPTTPTAEGEGGEETAAPTHHSKTPSGGLSLFGIRLGRSKEGKQLSELIDQEENERKRLQTDYFALDVEEMGRQAVEIHKQVRHALKHQAKARAQLEVDCKEGFDRLYLERKGGLEEMKREHLLEAKLTHKKEKERRKHAAMVVAPQSPTQEELAVGIVAPPPPASTEVVEQVQ